MADFGGGGFIPPNPGPELEMMAQAQQDEMRRRGGGDHRPPKRPRGPRFGLLRRIVRRIRGGGD